jgi:D-serine deaminase-like pyridoxal phosphate-dependent protein
VLYDGTGGLEKKSAALSAPRGGPGWPRRAADDEEESGMRVEQLETPALVLDLDRMEENIREMRRLLAGTGIALRPHYKSHKCVELARRQIAEGAKGITCAKLGEAEDLVQAGFTDILIANQIVDPAKIARLAHLAKCCHMGVCVDNLDNVRSLSEAAARAGATIHCLVEYDVGMKRCGARTQEEFLALARAVEAADGLAFDGIQAYAGNLSHQEDRGAREREAEAVERKLRSLIAFLNEHGVSAREVSGVSTGTVEFKRRGGVYTEIQAGSYLFMDAAYARLSPGFKHALFIYATVVSTAGGRVVTDAGMKSCSVDQGNPVYEAYPDALVNMSEEHASFDADPEKPCRVGDVLRAIPGHGCTTVNLHDRITLVRDGEVEGFLTVTSRGKSR